LETVTVRTKAATLPGWPPRETSASWREDGGVVLRPRESMDLPGGDADRQCRYLEAAEVELKMLTPHAFRPT
jgi:hypothetical protein